MIGKHMVLSWFQRCALKGFVRHTAGKSGSAHNVCLERSRAQLVAMILATALPVSAFAADRGSERQRDDTLFSGTVPKLDLLGQSNSLADQATALYKRGFYSKAEPLFQQALAIREQTLSPENPLVAASLNDLAGLYRELGRYAEAEALYRRALEIKEKLLGSDDPALASSLNNLAALFSTQGRYDHAGPLFRRALSLKERASRSDDPDVARILNNVAQLYRLEGRYSEAEPPCKHALSILQQVLGPDHPDVATSLNNLAQLYSAQGRYDEAQPLYERALAIREQAFGPNHPVVAVSLNNLAELYRVQHRYGEAEPLYQRALRIREEALGPDHPDVATSLNDMAALYEALGRYGEAEPLYRRSLAIRDTKLGPDHPDIARSLSDLAMLYTAEGRRGETAPLYRRALAIREKVFGLNNLEIAESLSDLAFAYDAQGRYRDAEPLLRQALAVKEKVLGRENSDLAASLNNLATILTHDGRYGEAAPLYRRVLALTEQALGPDHPDIAKALNNLAVVSRAQGLNFIAEPLYRRALAIREKALGPNHPDVATSLNNLAALKVSQARFGEAEQLYRRALEIREKALGPYHTLVAFSLNKLAEVYAAEGQIELALSAGKRAVEILEKRVATGAPESSTGGSLAQGTERIYANYIRLAYLAAARKPQPGASVAAETFRIVQLAQASRTAQVMATVAASFAVGNDALAGAVRERLDLAGHFQLLDTDTVDVAGRPSTARKPAQEQAIRADVIDTARRLAEIDARIATEFPEYAELTNPEPVSFEPAARSLAADEALLTYFSTADKTWLWALRRDRIGFFRLDIGSDALANEVTALRAQLDPIHNANREPYPATQSYKLYETILAPAAPLLTGAHHLLIVPDSALQSLPPGVLVTRPPQKDPESPEEHRNIAWLARDYAITILPAASSLRAFRKLAAPVTAPAPFLGIGDPVPRQATPLRLASLDTLKERGAGERPFVPPETAGELRAVGNWLGASDDDLLLGERASKPMIRHMPLESYKIIEFATPALISGDIREPALVLTAPAGTQSDRDSLLTASNIAAFKLNADWVMLSACNTATASDNLPNAEGLPVLAKAFFYAGARSLLVSHWRAPPPAAVKLMTGVVAELEAHPAIGRSEALRRSILTMLDPASQPELAHPSAWSAFVVIGGGGAERE
jgi:tetratricopeptide (TPR) repeat protein/CHAT domain-containing protein